MRQFLKLHSPKIIHFFLHSKHCPSSQSPTQSPTLSHPPSPSPLRWWDHPGYPPILAYQISAGLDESSPTAARKGSPVRDQILLTVFRDNQPPHLQLLGDPHGDCATHLLPMCQGLKPVCVCSLIGVSVYESFQGSRFVVSVGLCEVPILFRAFSPSASYSIRFPTSFHFFSSLYLYVSVSCWVELLRGQLC